VSSLLPTQPRTDEFSTVLSDEALTRHVRTPTVSEALPAPSASRRASDTATHLYINHSVRPAKTSH